MTQTSLDDRCWPQSDILNLEIVVSPTDEGGDEVTCAQLKQLNYLLITCIFPLELITTHRFGLDDLAIRSVGGEGVPDVIHASLMLWL